MGNVPALMLVQVMLDPWRKLGRGRHLASACTALEVMNFVSLESN